jgi:hypothetical protein
MVTDNYGEAGALDLFGRNLPPVASTQVTMRYWRPRVAGRHALPRRVLPPRRHLLHRLPRRRPDLFGQRQRRGGEPIAHCTLRATLAQVWPSIVATQEN